MWNMTPSGCCSETQSSPLHFLSWGTSVPSRSVAFLFSVAITWYVLASLLEAVQFSVPLHPVLQVKTWDGQNQGWVKAPRRTSLVWPFCWKWPFTSACLVFLWNCSLLHLHLSPPLLKTPLQMRCSRRVPSLILFSPPSADMQGQWVPSCIGLPALLGHSSPHPVHPGSGPDFPLECLPLLLSTSITSILPLGVCVCLCLPHSAVWRHLWFSNMMCSFRAWPISKYCPHTWTVLFIFLFLVARTVPGTWQGCSKCWQMPNIFCLAKCTTWYHLTPFVYFS